MTHTAGDLFDFNGLVPHRLIDDSQWQQRYQTMAEAQRTFLAQKDRFRSADYRWPDNALDNWSRIVEYPYVYHHVHRFMANDTAQNPVRILDFGCGVTFFPLQLAQLGADVIGVDIDPVCATDIDRIAQAFPLDSGSLSFQLSKNGTLPLEDSSLDLAYSISVLEHIPTPSQPVQELARVLKPGGLLILTIDIDLRGDACIGPQAWHTLHNTLAEDFEPVFQSPPIHPKSLLTSKNSPYSLPGAAHGSAWPYRFLVRKLLRPLQGKAAGHMSAPELAVECMVLRKRLTA